MSDWRGTPHDVEQLILSAAERLARSGIDQPRREAQILLGHALGVDRAALIGRSRTQVSVQSCGLFEAYIGRRCLREPLAYITGERHWLDFRVAVNRHVLIPRPETELLVELIAQTIEEYRATDGVKAKNRSGERDSAPCSDATIVDVGTGSGVLAIGASRRFPAARVIACDISPGALRCATVNCLAQGAPSVTLVLSDLLQEISGPIDIVVANLPYIPEAAIAMLEPELWFEPPGALDGGSDGLHLFRRLFAQASTRMSARGALLLEVGHDQAATVRRLALDNWPNAVIDIKRDYAQIERFITVRLQ